MGRHARCLPCARRQEKIGLRYPRNHVTFLCVLCCLATSITVLAGRDAIVALQRYLARQRATEAMPDAQRRQSLRDDAAMVRLGKGVCPGCERPAELKDAKSDYCPHGGIGLFGRCTCCTTRKNAFARFCSSCGTSANTALAD
jgi:hypothetical protein